MLRWVSLAAIITLAHGAVDLCFGIDLGNTTDAEWNKMLDYAAEYSAVIFAAEPGSRVGVVVGNDDAAFLLVKQNDHLNDIVALQAAIRSIPYQVNPGRDLAKLLFIIHEHCFNAINGDQPGVANKAVLITDGVSDAASEQFDANLLKAEAEITTIGVGLSYTDKVQLSSIATASNSYFIYTHAQLTTDLICAIVQSMPCITPTITSNQLTGDTKWTETVPNALQGTYLDTTTAKSDISDPTNIVDDPEFMDPFESWMGTTCTRNCSGHGICNSKGACDCDEGYIGEDCSLEAGTPPTPISYKGPDLCDVIEKPCQGVFVLADNVVQSDAITCKTVITTVGGTSLTHVRPAVVYTSNTIKCPLPTFAEVDDMAYFYSVMLSNDGATYAGVPGDTASRTVWSSEQMWLECLEQGVYVLKEESCAIDGVCYRAGYQKDANYICDPVIKNQDWTLTGQTCEVHRDGKVITFTGSELTGALPAGKKITLASTNLEGGNEDNCKFELMARKKALVKYARFLLGLHPVNIHKYYRKYQFQHDDRVKQLGYKDKSHIWLTEDMMPFNLDDSLSAEPLQVTLDITESGHGWILSSNTCQYSVLYLFDEAEPRLILTVGEQYHGAVLGPCAST